MGQKPLGVLVTRSALRWWCRFVDSTPSGVSQQICEETDNKGLTRSEIPINEGRWRTFGPLEVSCSDKDTSMSQEVVTYRQGF